MDFWPYDEPECKKPQIFPVDSPFLVDSPMVDCRTDIPITSKSKKPWTLVPLVAPVFSSLPVSDIPFAVAEVDGTLSGPDHSPRCRWNPLARPNLPWNPEQSERHPPGETWRAPTSSSRGVHVWHRPTRRPPLHRGRMASTPFQVGCYSWGKSFAWPRTCHKWPLAGGFNHF